MTKTEITSLKILVKDYIIANGIPDDIKKGMSVDTAKWVGEIIVKVAEQKGMIK